ncbi:MAG: hypothetical protein J5999_06370 [Oscillospiraceae bacterium]|nr:hypothetical protein [Oscillospiraceae bacterium]
MNMKKTFAGAMAGALAVSAMATSASASIPGPGEYTVDLTKEAEFFATVQFTFDNTYIVDKAIYENGGELELTFADKSGDFNLNGAKEVKVEVEGAKGTAKQTVIYNTTWNDVNFLDWNLFNWSGSTLKVPALANSNTAATKQSIYLDKFNTFNQAYATTTSAGAKIYPVVGTYDAKDGVWTTTTTGDRDAKLDTTVIEKIVVTAKFPVYKKFTLDGLNSISGYKNVVTASIKGLTNVDVYAVDNTEYMAAAANLKTALLAQGAIAAAEAADKVAADELVKLNDLLTAEGFKTVASAADAAKEIGHSTGATDTAGIKKIEEKIADVLKLEEAAAKLWKQVPTAYVGKTSNDMVQIVKDLQVIVDAYKNSLGVSTVGVQIADTNTVVGETLFTKFESNKIGVKSGVIIDNGTVKTLAGDIGAWKPDALRIIADAIADNEGVTLTFTAKDNFDDATYRAWNYGWMDYVDSVIGGLNADVAYINRYNTESVKEDYEVWGESMFTGAIILNRDFSKQFSQSNLVDWGTNTITFDWDELTEGRFYDASIVLHTMEILSTQNVEWVSCTVTVPEQSAEAEDVAPSQGADDDSTVIDDTPVETEPAEVITEAPVTEAPVVTEAPAPVAPVTNPTTGNAPVALAVIPVALAAAAIVAKKRG